MHFGSGGPTHFQRKDKAYQFNCLSFGLSSVPLVFTKTTRLVVANMRELGLHLIIYIDDTLVMAETESLLRNHGTAVIYLLENMGVVINYPKSELTSTQEIEFLSSVNSTKLELKLPGEKMNKIRNEAGKIRQSHTVSALMLSRIIGKMNAATPASPIAPLYYRNLQACPLEALLSNSTDRGSQRRTGMVVRSLYQVKRSESDHPQLLPHNRDRCLDKRVGSSVQQSPHREPTGMDYAHKLPRAASSSPGSKLFCQEQNKSDCPYKDGQCVSTNIHQQTRGNNISTTSQRTMAVVHGEEYTSQGTTPTWCSEHHSRQ